VAFSAFSTRIERRRAPAPGILSAQGRAGGAPATAADESLPGVIRPWSVSIPSESKLRELGATVAEAGSFSTQARRTGDCVGMPVYSRVNEYYEGAPSEQPTIVISRP